LYQEIHPKLLPCQNLNPGGRELDAHDATKITLFVIKGLGVESPYCRRGIFTFAVAFKAVPFYPNRCGKMVVILSLLRLIGHEPFFIVTVLTKKLYGLHLQSVGSIPGIPRAVRNVVKR
jgi:hypothetical protein